MLRPNCIAHSAIKTIVIIKSDDRHTVIDFIKETHFYNKL